MSGTEANKIESPCEVHELPLYPSITPSSSPPLASIAKKISPSAVEAVAVDRKTGVGRTPEAALELGTLSRSG
jgi:hypothetical protein